MISDPVDLNGVSRTLTDVATDSEVCSNIFAKGVQDEHGSIFIPQQVELSNLGANAEITPHYEYYSKVKLNYKIPVSGLYSIIVEVCDNRIGQTVIDGTVKLSGEVVFENPYGYLSGIYYGYMPFEGLRACVFGLFTFLYAILLFIHRHTLLVTNWFILIVVFFCTIESILWFASYLNMNETGEPYCCPFPNLISASMVFQVFRRSLSRCLLLSICMGLGLARDSFTRKEMMLILTLTLAYLTASLTVSVHEVSEMSKLNRDSRDSLYWDLPELLLDVIFLIWIYVALMDTMTDLKMAGQR